MNSLNFMLLNDIDWGTVKENASIISETVQKNATVVQETASEVLRNTTNILQNTTANSTGSYFNVQEALGNASASFSDMFSNPTVDGAKTVLESGWSVLSNTASWGWYLLPDWSKMLLGIGLVFFLFSRKTSVKVENHIHMPPNTQPSSPSSKLRLITRTEVNELTQIARMAQTVNGRVVIEQFGIDMEKKDFLEMVKGIIEEMKRSPSDDLIVEFAC
ncbi:MAG: hypothetical protein JSS32_05265 [Verrucomicrobia bacterium]|nr:hypothetical protein [Verrucomicrobiota bacterium]